MKIKCEKPTLAYAPTVKQLYRAVAISLMAAASSYVQAADDYKTIGDLEIYQAAKQGSATIAMMLDVSGSMAMVDFTESSNATARMVGPYSRLQYDGSIANYTCAYRATPSVSGGAWNQNLNTFNQPIFSPPLSSLRAHRVDNNLTNYYSGNTLVYTKRRSTRGYFYYNSSGALIAVEFGDITRGGYILHRKLSRQVTLDITDADGNKDSTITFTVEGCGGQNGQLNLDESGNVIQSFDSSNRPTHGYLDRLSSLKLGLIGLLADGTRLPESNKIAIGIFPNGDTTRMDKAAQSLTLDRRKELISYIAGLRAYGGTPSAQAYATAGAYLMGTTPGNVNGGDPFYWSAAETKQGNVYKSPIDNNSCDGYGVYFMTDGEPNLNNNRPQTMMRNSLNNQFNRYMTCGSTIISSSQAGIRTLSDVGTAYENPAQGPLNKGHWDCIGTYSQLLYDANYNLSKKQLKTATVGFGGIFAGFKTKMHSYTDNLGRKFTKEIPDCNTAPNQDAKNLCMLGSLDGNFGRGGFTSTGKPDELAKSIEEFIGSLTSILPTAPSGTISIPSDPLDANNIQPYAYLPMIQPEVDASFATWEGNLKKYHTLYGTLYGQNRTHLYQKATNATVNNADFPSKLNPDVRDIWQDDDFVLNGKNANDKVSAGGSKNKLPSPTSRNDNNVRTVYLETTKNNQRVLQKVGVSNGQLTGFDQLEGYSVVDMAYVLNLLGFAVSVEESTYNPTGRETTATQLQNLQTALNNAAVSGVKALGGVAHSSPVLAAYGGEFDAKGEIVNDESKRKDRLIYGTMDGVLHMIEARTGEETFSFIPRATFDDTDQRHALLPGSTYNKIGQPKFGMDGPWTINAAYSYATSNGTMTMTASKMYAYGGMRMGGIGLYGLNVSDPNSPTLAFSINDDTPGFERLGQTWAKPLVATIKTGPKSTDTKKVLIVGGGYDMCYENPLFKLNDASNPDENCKNLTQAKGNAVYMLDAETGRLLQSWTTAKGGDAQYMKHSIVSEIVPRDRNNNGTVDHLYFADLGGQVFRIDLQEGVAANASNLTRQIVRIFDANEGVDTANHIPYRFYEKPAVSIHDMGGSRIAMIAISSGDRSSPAHKRRTLEDSNRIYGIVDRDVATSRVVTGEGLISRNLKTSNLQYYDTKELETTTDAKRLEYIANLKSGIAQGWYYSMTRFDIYPDVRYLKAIGSSMTLGNIYYTSIYSPEYRYTKLGNTCEAEILGGTERQMFCMPWGICANINTGRLVNQSKNGTLGFVQAGPGIQEMAMTTVTDTVGESTNQVTIVGNQSSSDTFNSNRTGHSGDGLSGGSTGDGRPGPGGNTLGQSPVFTENTIFRMTRWYDLQNADGGN